MQKAAIAILALTMALPSLSARASTVNVSVDPLVTEMHVAPGLAGHTSMSIANNGDVDETITIRPVDWTTQLDGIISLYAPGALGGHSLTAWLEPAAYRLTLRAHERRELDVALAVPASARAPRSYWGGLLVRATPIGQILAIGPAATLFVYNDVGTPKRHVSIKAFHAVAGTGGSAVVTMRLKNDGDAYARTGATLTISRAGSVVQKRDVSIGAIFPGHTRIVEQAVSGLSSGTYDADITIDYGGDVIVGGETKIVVP